MPCAFRSALGGWRSLGCPWPMSVGSSTEGLVLGDLEVNTRSIHSLIYSVLVSPAASQVVPVQAFSLALGCDGACCTKLAMAPGCRHRCEPGSEEMVPGSGVPRVAVS